jgi:hypothetical protein
MSLLDTASLIVTPNAYKEGKLYSVIPSDGSGDMSVVRATTATRVNSAGLVELVPYNLLQYSEDFTNAAWIKITTTLTSGQSDPFGGNNAYKWNSSAIGVTQLSQLFSTGADVCNISIYAKAGSTSILNIWIGSAVTFDLANGSVTSGTGTITSVGNGWYRCSTNRSSISLTNTLNPYFSAASTSDFIYIYGGQAVEGSTAKDYQKTETRLNIPRLDYSNGTCPSLLVEPQRTNVVLNSENFSNASWLKTAITLTANATISPDGTTNATSIIPTTANVGNHRVYEGGLNTIATAAYSIYVKPNGYNRVALRESATTGAAIGYDLLNKTIITTYSTGGCTASGGIIEEVGNGWYRISGIFSFATATSQSLGFYIVSPSWTSGDPESVTWAGNGTDGVLVWGAQVEAGAYPTSYIPTTSASVTRNADVISKTGISSLIGQTEGVVFLDFTVDTISAQTNNPVLWYMKDGAAGERYVELYSNGNLVYVDAGNVTNATITKTGLTVGRHKCAIAYATNDFVFYVDGVQVGTDTSGTPNGFSTFGLQYYNAAFNGQQMVNLATLFPTRLTNAELASLTTL